ncbi:hypothetical protein QBC47DRAFT_381192 [Echria macrotheca]|uniref:Uncharacterized protein n=1 Tax=Echria macrotheca TaxID=438768 RepID=A0AAJ0BCJ0_9PEZI|nr:hypothetical protein QBC47DRAFT_381192 [Echria macrotheca]
MASKKATTNISSGLSKLSLDTTKTGPKTEKKKPASPVADSWEDEDVSSASDGGDDEPGSDHSASEQNEGADRHGKSSRGGAGQAGTTAPPPTPMSPTYSSKRPFSPGNLNAAPFDLPYGPDTGDNTGAPASATIRPEKTDAVARRMIASALGVKVPKQTEEQKKYDKAMREKERRRREEEKERERKRAEEAAKAKQAVWED